MTRWQCPHCRAELGEATHPLPEQAAPCPACRLLIAQGRGVDAAAERPAKRSSAHGSLIAASARRAGGEPVTAQATALALQRVAAELGIATARLRLTDYAEAAARDPELVAVSDLIGTWGGWKATRQAAVDGGPAA